MDWYYSTIVTNITTAARESSSTCVDNCLGRLNMYTFFSPGMSEVAQNWLRLVPNGAHLGLFNISFQYGIWDQSDLFGSNSDLPVSPTV